MILDNEKKIVNPLNNPLKLFATVLDGLTGSNNDFRANALTDEFDGITVDTACPPDTDKWETGVCRKSDTWIIVEQYPNKIAAEIGHKKWVEKLKKEPNIKLVDIFYQDMGWPDDETTD